MLLESSHKKVVSPGQEQDKNIWLEMLNVRHAAAIVLLIYSVRISRVWKNCETEMVISTWRFCAVEVERHWSFQSELRVCV